MSPNVGNFVQDLVHMAQATERLPQVEAENNELHNMVENYAKQVQEREISILSLKAEIEGLNQRIQAAEVARDDAEMRFLELDDKASKAVHFLAQIQGMAVQAELALEPPKPEPLPEPEPVKEHDVLASNTLGYRPETTQGQSESNPQQVSAESGATTTTDPAPVSSETAEPLHAQPYLGKFYYDHPVYVSLENWLEGGGSEENYYRSKPRDFSTNQF